MTRSCAENTSDFSVTVLLQVSATNLRYSTDGNFMFQENRNHERMKDTHTHTHLRNARDTVEMRNKAPWLQFKAQRFNLVSEYVLVVHNKKEMNKKKYIQNISSLLLLPLAFTWFSNDSFIFLCIIRWALRCIISGLYITSLSQNVNIASKRIKMNGSIET